MISGLVKDYNGLHWGAFQYGPHTNTRVLAIQISCNDGCDSNVINRVYKHLHDFFAKMLRIS
jgi:hypothetical protein